MWFLFALICLLGWGFADLFYKKGANENDSQSHLKTAVWVGLVMGICAFVMMPFSESNFSLINIVKYSPASLSYIISMVLISDEIKVKPVSSVIAFMSPTITK